MALKWRAPGAALGQKLDLEIGRARFNSDNAYTSIMHAGTRPAADRRLPCPGVTFRQAHRVKTFHCFNPTKKLPHGDFQFFEKRVAFGLILMAEKPKNPTKGSAAKLPTLPRSF